MRSRRRARRAEQAGAEHDRRRVVSAADMAIAAAWRRRPPGQFEGVWVTVEDVRTTALEQFGLEVPTSSAAAVLRERFRLRGAGLFGAMVTDAFDVEV